MFFYENWMEESKMPYRLFSSINHRFPEHFHRSFELITVNDGQFNLHIRQCDISMSAGDTALIFPNQIHAFKTIDYSRTTTLIFRPELVSAFHLEYKNLIPLNNVFQYDSLHESDMHFSNLYQLKGFLYKICGNFSENTRVIKIDKQSTDSFLQYKMLTYIDEHLAVNCTLNELSKEIQYDYAYTSKMFIKFFGMTFGDYLNQYRINHACHLLKNSDKSICDIASVCGYDNLRTFNRNFKKLTQMSPSDYRQCNLSLI